jgi:hypothetical protein
LLSLCLTACGSTSRLIAPPSDQTAETLQAALDAAGTIDREHLTPCAEPESAWRAPATFGESTGQTDAALAWGLCERARADGLAVWIDALAAALRARLEAARAGRDSGGGN